MPHNGINPSTDAEWDASGDYKALVRAEIVKGDDKRMKAAEKWGKKIEKARIAEEAAADEVQKLWT